MADNKKFPSDEDAAAFLDKWSNREAPYDGQAIDYELKPGQAVPPSYRRSVWDRIWTWFRSP